MQHQNKGKLRIGLLLPSLEIPAWIFLMIKKIMYSSYAEISLAILDNNIKKLPNSFLYRTYNKFDSQFITNPDAFEIKNASKLLEKVAKIKVNSTEENNLCLFSDEQIDEFLAFNLDVIFSIESRNFNEKILGTAKFGVWNYEFGYRLNEPEAFREVLEKQPVIRSILKRQSTKPAKSDILYTSYSAVDHISVKRTRNILYWKTLSFFPRTLQKLFQQGETKFFENLSPDESMNILENVKHQHNNLLKNILSLIKDYKKTKFSKPKFFDQWILMYNFNNAPSKSFSNFNKLIPPKDRFWADPFVIDIKNKYYIFFEEFIFKNNKGHISMIVMDEDGKYSKPQKILEQNYHLSYPFIFKYQGKYYLIPETSSNKTIEIYKCLEFPSKWQFEKNIMEGIFAVDSTIFYHNDKWWLFTGLAENEGSSPWDELFLFYADNPLSSHWLPHPQNPIVSDVRNARPAGRIFENNAKLIRPSQNNSKSYGFGLVFNHIITLNENQYNERIVETVIPDWEPQINGIHTLNFANKLTLIDAKLRTELKSKN